MTLSSSLNAGVAGLSVNSSKLGTISDNIANSQTTGYKRSDIDFSSLVVTEAGASRYSAGGVTSTVFREVDGRGNLIASENATDVAIGGRGFIPVTPIASLDNLDGDLDVRYVTTGSFRPDENGILRTASGFALLGVAANRDGSIPAFARDTPQSLEPVQINNGSLLGAPTANIGLGVNLPAVQTQSTASGDAIPLSIEYFDNLSASQTLDITFTPTIPATGSSNEWTVSIDDSQSAANPIASFVVTFDNTPAAGGSIATVTGAVGGAYDPLTGIFDITTGGGPINLDIGTPGGVGGLSQLAAEFGPTGVIKDGAPVGALSTVTIDENGLVKGVFDGGFVNTLYQVPVANFSNINGLTAQDGQTFTQSPNSGSLFLWDAGDGPTGSVIGFAREGSSADIATELTSLIETQRAYSSNASVIRTVDEMLQETTNLKR